MSSTYWATATTSEVIKLIDDYYRQLAPRQVKRKNLFDF